MTDKLRNNKTTVIIIMGLLTAIGPLSIDMYLPAFPAIAKSLHSSVSAVTLSLSSFFIGISGGQLLYGPLLERYGRKNPLYFGLSLYFLASVGCALAPSVNSLIVFRFFQALGGCAGMVATRAMVRDLFDVKDNAKVFSTLMLVVAVSPIIAPTLGGFITAVLGWRWVFVMLILVILLILAGSILYLPESKPPDPTFSLRPGAIFKNFGSVLSNRQFLTFALTGAVSYGGLYAYIGGSPYVFMELFTVSETEFGLIFSLIAAGIIGGSQVNNIAMKYYSSEQVIRMATLFKAVIGIIMVSLTVAGWSNLWGTIVLVFLFLGGQGFIFPNSTAVALAPMGGNAGNASALIGAIQMTIGAGAAALISIVQNHTALPMVAVMAGCALTAVVIYDIGRKAIAQQTTRQAVQEEEVDMMSQL